MKKRKTILIVVLPILVAMYNSIFISNSETNVYINNLTDIPSYSGEEYIIINNNTPSFTSEDMEIEEMYYDLDELGRATGAIAKVSEETVPSKERGSIGMIKPTGWHTVKYSVVDGKYLYNRCHLIAYQLTGQNANEKNLITCTRNMNASVMTIFENEVREYIDSTSNHVLYRVTPYYEEDNLLATGVEIEAYSIEDEGEGIKINVFIYNVQDQITIDYKTGESKLT